MLSQFSRVQLFATPWTVAPPPRDSPGKNTRVGCHTLLQGIFQPRDQTQVCCTADGLFTSWATREAQEYWSGLLFLMPDNTFEDLITFPPRSTLHQHLMPHILMFCGGCCYHGNIWPLSTNSFFLFFLIYAHMLSVHLFVILWTVARQVPLSMEFSRQEYWSR